MNEIEKQFFETFDIQHQFCSDNWPNPCKFHCDDCEFNTERYPQINNSILLELILINMHNEDLFGYPTNIQELKDNTLKQLIKTYNKFSSCVTCDGEYQQSARNIKHQVQELFKGN